jgi:hypothetical protein
MGKNAGILVVAGLESLITSLKVLELAKPHLLYALFMEPVFSYGFYLLTVGPLGKSHSSFSYPVGCCDVKYGNARHIVCTL